ncbi:MAG: hypothetical protein WD058_02840 [Dehalococcoidia bacterium]
MGILSRLFGGGSKDAPVETGPVPVCGHLTLIPHWDSAADMGAADKISNYHCESCHEQFTREEAASMRAAGGT